MMFSHSFRFHIARALALLAVVATAGAGRAQELPPALQKPTITVAQALSMLQALRNLDGRQVIVKAPSGADTVVMVPWDLNSGALRMKVATDIVILTAIEKAADEARIAIVRDIQRASGLSSLQPGTAEMESFLRQYSDVLNAPADNVSLLARIKTTDLKLDKNEIPVTALSALMPILDDK